MIFQHIRNATVKIKYDDVVFLVDPWFAKKGSLRAIETLDANKNKIKNPTVELPISIEEIVEGVDVCIITHNHIDHFDEESMSYLNKNIKVFVQNEEDKKVVEQLGYYNIEILAREGSTYQNVTIFKTPGQHGETKETADGQVSGFILSSYNEDKLYLCGDSVWYEEIEKTLIKYTPENIILNAGAAYYKDVRLLMDLDDIMSVYQNSANAKIFVIHLDAVNHGFVNRNDVKKLVKEHDLKNVYIPEDGEQFYL